MKTSNILSFILSCAFLFWSDIGWTLNPTPSSGELRLQIIQSELTLNYDNVAKASLVDLGRGQVGLKIILKQQAGDDLKQLTYQAMGKSMNLVFNNKIISRTIIQSSLGNELLMTGFTKDEAQLFLNTLAEIDKKRMLRQNPPSLLSEMNREPQLITSQVS